MGRWFMMLMVSLFGALRVFRRFRERSRAPGAEGGDGAGLKLGPAASKLAPIWAGFSKQLGVALGGTAAPAEEVAPPPAFVAEARRGSQFVLLTAITAWALFAVAAGSFFFDRGSTARSFVFLSAVSGLVGYWTTWISIRLLFKPTRPRFGFGVIPANRAALIGRLSSAIETHLINPETLAAWLHQRGVVADAIRTWHQAFARLLDSPEFRTDLKARLAATGRLYVTDDDFRRALGDRVADVTRGMFREKLWKWVADLVEKPVLDRIRSELDRGLANHGDQMIDDAVSRLDGWLDGLNATIARSLPDLEEAVSDQVVAGLRRLDIRGLIEQQLASLHDGDLERLIHEATRNELAALEVMGGLLGVIVGVFMPLFV